ncbi:MAG: RNA polymerase sigma factor [Acidobacteria bacterium]|nr:RNA polymerase sigma factor [Acidobacteriota bacterium]
MNPAIPLANMVAASGTPVEALRMTEAGFRDLYAQHARPLKSYLARMTGNAVLAEDLMQEAFYRLMRSELPAMDEAQRKSYLYRTATNLARDHFRGKKFEPAPLDERIATRAQEGQSGAEIQLSADIQKVLNGIKPNERALMWMAYVEGATHREIAAVTGLKEASVRPLLFRVKQKLAALLRERGFRQETGR